MKFWICIGVAMLLCAGIGHTQSLQGGEYFFDTDPGVGKGTPISFSPGDTLRLQPLNIPTAGLTPGFHNLAVRFKNINGTWSFTETRAFLLDQLNVSETSITGAEYFFDADPGPGKGTPLAIGNGATVSQQVAIPLPTLASGFHNMGIRVKNNDGMWGLFEPRPFYLVTIDDASRQIVAAEYFVDIDPGVGMAASISIPSPTALFQANLQLPLPQGLSNGQHFLLARVKDNLGSWSLLTIDTFSIDNSLPVTGMHLSGKALADGHLLQWYTLTESGTQYFDIEHSSDGINFSRVGAQAAAGNSNTRKEYSYLQQNRNKGMHYYRLKQVDVDGKHAYSNIVLIGEDGFADNVVLYPNPAKDILNIKSPILITNNNVVIATIYNFQGQIVSTQKLLRNSLDISKFPSGTYFLFISDGKERGSAKFIKQ